MKSQSYWDYYGVKIIKQLIVEGEPDPAIIDEYYDDDGKHLFEGSVVLIHAQPFEHALKIAEKKAIKDEKSGSNGYGQIATWKLIKVVDCSLIIDEMDVTPEIKANSI